MKKLSLLILCMGFFVVMGPQTGFAYTDLIQNISLDEVWEASNQVLEPYGIRKSKGKKYLESKWVEDRVERTKSLIPFREELATYKQKVDRRYRIRMYLEEVKGGINVRVTGRFQLRRDLSRDNSPWHKIKPQSEDYIIERETFFKLLTQIEKNRAKVEDEEIAQLLA